MSVINATPLLAAAGGDYQISRSVRLRSSASGYFNRTPASAGNRTTWTWSGWVKLGALVDETFVSLGTTLGVNLRYASGALQSNILTVGSTTSTAVYRDPSAWYHIVLAVDTTQASNNSRLRIYVNGSEVAYSANATITQNANLGANSTTLHTLGVDSRAGSVTAGTYFDGYLTEINFIDGQALTPASFGETNTVTGVWQPKKYAGTYGTNGFYLNFSDPSAATATTIGKDYSGNGNNWTPNNISVTAGVTYDSMLDVPTLYADGGNGRGNYAVMNPLPRANIGLSRGNLTLTTAGGAGSNQWCLSPATMFLTSGKWYAEFNIDSKTADAGGASIGIGAQSDLAASTFTLGSYLGNQTNGEYSYQAHGYTYFNNVQSGTPVYASYTTGDTIGIALDLDAYTVAFYKNNALQGSTSLLTGRGYAFAASIYQASICSANFGQRPFAYTPPTGFKALNTQNLPEPTIKKGNQYFDATLYTGNGTTQSIVNSGSMQPDLVWYKSRSAALFHHVFDSNRGANKQLHTNDTGAESTQTQALTSFNSNGFTVGSNVGGNQNGTTYVGWQWKANGAGSSNTAGTITSTVSANQTAGFSIISYTGNGTTGATVGHGLGAAPKFIIWKPRASVSDWMVWHIGLSGYNYDVRLNTTAAQGTGADPLNNTAPSSTVITLRNQGDVNGSGASIICYAFAAVPGFSKFGSYTGNGSADGPFVFCGFRPRFIMIKDSANATDWKIHDTSRDPYNQLVNSVAANSSAAEGVYGGAQGIDILSNGFKIRQSGAPLNTSGATTIFAAFAEHPFKNSLAR